MSDLPAHFHDYSRGIATPLDLNAGQVLYHGTLAKEFTHEYPPNQPFPYHYTHPPTPDGPAWFASNELFSLHAAVRFTSPNTPAEIHLHSYTVYSRIALMSLPTIEDFRIFMREQHQLTVDFNGLVEGIVLARLSNDTGSRLDGYALLEDTVRGEPEYVLFASGLRQLRQAGEVRTISVVPINGESSRLVDKTTGQQLAVYTYDEGPGTLV